MEMTSKFFDFCDDIMGICGKYKNIIFYPHHHVFQVTIWSIICSDNLRYHLIFFYIECLHGFDKEMTNDFFKETKISNADVCKVPKMEDEEKCLIKIGNYYSIDQIKPL